MHEFTSRSKDTKAPVTRKLKFKLDGSEFTAQLKVDDADAVLEWSELAAGAAASEADVESPEAMAFMSRFFRLMLPDGEYKRFRLHLKAHKTDPEVLVQIMDTINDEMQDAFEEQTDRPTQPSSSSSGGPRETDERRLQIISLAAQGDVEFAEPPTGGEIPHEITEVGPKQVRQQPKRRKRSA